MQQCCISTWTQAGSVPQGSRGRTWALGRLSLSLQRSAFLQASFPGWPARDTKVRMAQLQAATMPCNPHAASTLLPTMGPFMRAGMECEGLGTNSSTEPQPSE